MATDIHARPTPTALRKAGEICDAVAKLATTAEKLRWLREAVLNGSEVSPDLLYPDQDARVVELPSEFATDFGDRLVAIIRPCKYGTGDLVIVTVKPRQRIVKPVEEPAMTPRTSTSRAAANKDVPPPLPKVSRSRVKPEPPPRQRARLARAYKGHGRTTTGRSVEPADNRGAQALRAEVARMNVTRESLARAIDISPATFSDIVLGYSQPTMPLAVALRRIFGIPVDAWVDVTPAHVPDDLRDRVEKRRSAPPGPPTRRGPASKAPTPHMVEIARLRRLGRTHPEIGRILGITASASGSQCVEARRRGLSTDPE